VTAELLEFQDNATEWPEDATPVPDKVMLTGEFWALLIIVRLPAKFPMVKGVNVACTAAVCLGLTVSPEALPLAVNPGPETETPEIVTLELPVFVNVTVCSALAANPVLPKFKLLTLAISGDGDPVTVVGDDERETLQTPSPPAELNTPTVLSTDAEACSERNATFDPKVICRERSTT
jgi:hypothetical protein